MIDVPILLGWKSKRSSLSLLSADSLKMDGQQHTVNYCSSVACIASLHRQWPTSLCRPSSSLPCGASSGPLGCARLLFGINNNNSLVDHAGGESGAGGPYRVEF